MTGPTETIARLEAMTDHVQFEQLCAELMPEFGYAGLVPQGVGRRDGGKDAIRRILGSRRIEAAFRVGRLPMFVGSTDSYVMAILADYLDCGSLNAVCALSALYRNGGGALQKAVLQPDRVSSMLDRIPLDRWDGLADAARLIRALWRQTGSAKQGPAHDLWRRVQDAITERLPALAGEGGSYGFLTFLAAARHFNRGIHRRALELIDPSRLGEACRPLRLLIIREFLDTASRRGLDKEDLKAFCDGLDFTDLGRRSRDVGLATVWIFLSTASRAGVDKADLKVFCDGLDFRDLGRRSRDTGLATVANFMQVASRVGVSDDALSSFAAGLDFRSLGRAFGRGCEPDDEGMRSASLNTLVWAARNRGVSIHQAREFVLGWGFPKWPALMELSEPQRDRLLADADLPDLVTFLTRFRPGEAYCRFPFPARLPGVRIMRP